MNKKNLTLDDCCDLYGVKKEHRPLARNLIKQAENNDKKRHVRNIFITNRLIKFLKMV